MAEMQRKRQSAIRFFDPDKAGDIVRVLLEYQQLKTLFRQGWLRTRVPKEQCETVAEHSLGVALLALLVADGMRQDLDREKMVTMAMLHDFGEIYAGDLVPGAASAADKHAREKASVEKVFGGLPEAARYLALWEEFEAQETEEARVVKALDRLEMGVQAMVYEREGWGPLEDFMETTRKAVGGGALGELVQQLDALRRPAVPSNS
ncbi:MAG: HD domain-containing protein [Kiritimatiellae bacterium]|nr:HD domain-containing protein [Kiritimatiellia bacterium]MBQ9345126.1 HD domain-containing protein [Kiritimatiellia bacterium]